MKNEETTSLDQTNSVPSGRTDPVFPQIDFLYKACDQRHHDYRHERVGAHRYDPITPPILAVSMEDASQKAIWLPRVKHHSLQAVLAVLKAAEEILLAPCQAKRENPSFVFTSDIVAKSRLQNHRHERMDDGSTGPSETRRHRRRKR